MSCDSQCNSKNVIMCNSSSELDQTGSDNSIEQSKKLNYSLYGTLDNKINRDMGFPAMWFVRHMCSLIRAFASRLNIL